ncbi:UL46 protein [Gallid alphaherpesvirus 3]|uniref:UL46 protein n=2 Tax=Gallid alphaherpesvirus 3 TaxID=35250 RepID=A0A1P7TZM5_9ALPH|nr:tegument protein VP11/12 [Gallid alphaherpesvirus 3]YP_010795646.1 UL46 protein [Gallid alphaherpesvirus 3]BAA32582.1 tegument protein [Marek's disease virus serotype 2 MDV2]AEI00255.1 UL46 protein [Gallid alphaherpesvirus 3]QEY02233.1 UL46 protein [Gallid alphaherpesvirus 3]BAA82942.1 UL46 product homolog [Marek's disease virus serotype 2 MDV2]BAB16556.1 UL46 protein [Gallid alphaherpesvirus 3]
MDRYACASMSPELFTPTSPEPETDSLALNSRSRGSPTRVQEYPCQLSETTGTSLSGIRAQEDALVEVLPSGFLSALRQTLLRDAPSNKVPECIVVYLALGDASEEYTRPYRARIARRMKKKKLTRASVKRCYQASYMNYLEMRRDGCRAGSPETCDPTRREAALLFYPIINRNALVKKPFQLAKDNALYLRCWREIRDGTELIQKYAYYMRPDDVTAPSADTSIRLQLLLSYVRTLYTWAVWLMDVLDLRACPNVFGPRAPSDFDTVFLALAEAVSSLPSESWADTTMLCHFIGTVLAPLVHMGALWTCCAWRSSPESEVSRPVVAIVALVGLLNYRCQYILNMVFNGYAVWLQGGMANSTLRRALRQQKRFQCFLGELFPTMNSCTWADTESTVALWFKHARVKSTVTYQPAAKGGDSVVRCLQDSPQQSKRAWVEDGGETSEAPASNGQSIFTMHFTQDSPPPAQCSLTYLRSPTPTTASTSNGTRTDAEPSPASDRAATLPATFSIERNGCASTTGLAIPADMCNAVAVGSPSTVPETPPERLLEAPTGPRPKAVRKHRGGTVTVTEILRRLTMTSDV